MPVFKEGRKSSALSKEQWTDSGGATITVALLGTGYDATGRENTDLTWSAISANEVSAAGYARQNLTSKVLEEDDGNDRTWFNAATATFAITATSGSARWAAILNWDSGNNANSEILRIIDLRPLNGSSDVSFNGENVRLLWTDSHVFARRVE